MIHITPSMDDIAADAGIDEAFAWLCERQVIGLFINRYEFGVLLGFRINRFETSSGHEGSFTAAKTRD